jgi:predicted DNA-binding WGR domain protein
MKRNFIYKDEKSDKFWTIHLEGKVLTVIFGKSNTAGRTNVKEFSTVEESQREAEKLIKEKTRKGYLETIDIETSKSTFGVTEFWNLIERTKRKAFRDVEEQAEALIEILSERPPEDIIEFYRIFEYFHALSYRSDLWGAAYIIQGGCSDDMFDYFRAWLIAQGKDVFENALENPETLTRVISVEEAEEIDAECMLYVAGEAYERKTGTDWEKFLDLSGVVKFPELEFDWNEEDDSLKLKFPKLYKKYSS